MTALPTVAEANTHFSNLTSGPQTYMYPTVSAAQTPTIYYARQPDSAYVSPPAALPPTPPPPSAASPSRATLKLKRMFNVLTSSLSLEKEEQVVNNIAAPTVAATASAPFDEEERRGPTYGMPVSRAPLHTAFYQQIVNRAPVHKLLQQNLQLDALMQEGIQLHHFHDAGYSLQDLAQLVPSYQGLKLLGLNKHLLSERWSLVELCQRYGMTLGTVCGDLEFRAADLLRAKLGVNELQAMGLTADKLLWMGADFAFLLQLRCSPYDFQQKLGGNFESLAKFQLSKPQRIALGQACGWSPFALAGLMGFTVANVQDLWYCLDDLDAYN